jgi:hypothetical protein
MTAPTDPPTTRAKPDDAPTAVSSGGSARPPRRSNSRRTVSSSAAAAATTTKPVAAPSEPAPPDPALVEAELTGDDTSAPATTRTRSTRRRTPTKATRTSTPRPTPVITGMPRERRFRQTITKVDLWTVLKLSLCFYLSAMFVTLIALVALWLIADAAGVISSVENFLGDLLSAKNFTFLSGEVLRGAILIALVVVALQVVITVIAASFYNIFAELFGGLEITVREEEVEVR